MENLAEARRAVEAMLLVASDPTPVQLLAQLVELPVDVVQSMCRELAAEYERERRGFMLVEVAGGWRYQTHPDTHAYVERFALEGIPNRLSTAALETLAIVAYKQPISRGQIGAIRGVNVDGVLRTLVQRGYVDEQGRDDGPGQATLFGTTQYFLEQLGLMSLDDLPPLGDFVPSAEVLEALEQTLKVGPDEIDLTVGDTEDGPAEAETPPEPVVEEAESLPEPVGASEADEDPVFEVVTDAVEVVDRSAEPEESVETPAEDASGTDAGFDAEVDAEHVEPDVGSGLVLGGVVDAVVDAGVHNGQVDSPVEPIADVSELEGEGLPDPVDVAEAESGLPAEPHEVSDAHDDEIDIDPESGLVLGGVIDAVVDAGVHNGHVGSFAEHVAEVSEPEGEGLPDPVDVAEADEVDPVFEVVDPSVEPDAPVDDIPHDADADAGVDAEDVESDVGSGLVLGGVVDSVVDAGVHNGHVDVPADADDPAPIAEADTVDLDDGVEEPAEPATDLVAAGEWLDEADEAFTDDGDEDDLDPVDGGMELEVAAESQVEPTLGSDAIGAPSVDDAERFRSPGDGPSPPDSSAAGIVPGPGADHGLGERAYDPSAEEGLAAWPLNGHGPSGNGNGHRPAPGTGDA